MRVGEAFVAPLLMIPPPPHPFQAIPFPRRIHAPPRFSESLVYRTATPGHRSCQLGQHR